MRILLLGVTLFLFACSRSPDDPGSAPADDSEATTVDTAHNSRNSLDWAATYSGVLPCADCEGIRTLITLNSDSTYQRVSLYLGRSDEPRIDTGTLAWDDDGRIVTLYSGDGSGQSYFVGEDRLFHLDEDRQRITGDLADSYVLVRALRDPRLEDRKWVLTEVMGGSVDSSGDGPQAFLLLSSDGNRVSGNASCNGFFGGYTLEEGNRIRFDEKMGSTMMACPDMTTEQAFHEAIRKVDNYAIDGNSLSLSRAKMAPLLRFELARED